MVTADKTLICRDCGNGFIFTAGEQAFYAERGFVAPQRCPSCRAARRSDRQPSAGGDTSYDARPRQMAPREPRPLFPAICAECGRETMVPFEPRAGRPVYCRECFARRRSAF